MVLWAATVNHDWDYQAVSNAELENVAVISESVQDETEVRCSGRNGFRPLSWHIRIIIKDLYVIPK